MKIHETVLLSFGQGKGGKAFIRTLLFFMRKRKQLF